MSDPPRQPRVFAPDDPDLVVDASPDIDAAPVGGEAAPDASGASLARPTLAEIGRRGLSWGAVLAAALAGAASLSLVAWLANFVSAAEVKFWQQYAENLIEAVKKKDALLKQYEADAEVAQEQIEQMERERERLLEEDRKGDDPVILNRGDVERLREFKDRQ